MSSNEKIIEHLERGLGRIKKGWTQGVYARDISDNPISPEREEAVCWCMIGAISNETGSSLVEETRLELSRTIRARGHDSGSVSYFNDTEDRTQNDVVEIFQQTIDRLRAEVPVPSPA